MESYRRQAYGHLHLCAALCACLRISVVGLLRMWPCLAVSSASSNGALFRNRCRFLVSLHPHQLQTISRELSGLTSLILDSCDVGDVGVRSLSSMTQLEVRQSPLRVGVQVSCSWTPRLVDDSLAATFSSSLSLVNLVYSFGTITGDHS